jgi:amidohydrolase
MSGNKLLWPVRVIAACLGFTASHALAGAPVEGDLSQRVDQVLPSLLETYRQLHGSPELSFGEVRTSALLAERLRRAGYEVHTDIGPYTQANAAGHGVIAILRRGSGPRVLVRTDMDALPVTEETGLPYASSVRAIAAGGEEVGVAHACGHDIHMASFLGTAELLAQLKGRWRGTVMLVAQPAEEVAQGASAMLADGLYERFGRPDFVLALHVDPEVETGSIGYVPGYAMAAMTSVDILVRGIGGHGSRPEATKDPIVVSAQIINALQTIASREVSTLDQVVVTVGSIHGGSKRNVIPDQVTLLLTVRTYKKEILQQTLDSIARIARFTALAAGVPDNLLPQVTVRSDEKAPAIYNDPVLTNRLMVAFRTELDPDHVHEVRPIMASEDFGAFSLDNQIPLLLYRLGASDSAALERSRQTGVALPGLHSAAFAPVSDATIRTGVRTMTAAVLDLLAVKESTP